MNKQILLVCAAGMSTSLLVAKAKEIIKREHYSLQIRCCDMESVYNYAHLADIIILAPQVSYIYEEIRVIAEKYKIALTLISIENYGKFDGQIIIDLALNAYVHNQEQNPLIVEIVVMNNGIMASLITIDMRIYFESINLPHQIIVTPYSNFFPQKSSADIVLLEPLLNYATNDIQKNLSAVKTLGVIKRDHYTHFDGNAIAQYALLLREENIRQRRSTKKEI